jgi:hypothetical protein
LLIPHSADYYQSRELHHAVGDLDIQVRSLKFSSQILIVLFADDSGVVSAIAILATGGGRQTVKQSV